MRIFVKRLVLVVAIILMGMAPSSGVFAASDAFKGKAAQNRITIYDPEDECKDPVPGKTCAAVSGDEITWIGDSLTALDNWTSGQEDFESMFPGADYGEEFNGCSINDYVRSGKSMSWDTDRTACDDNNVGMSGFSILKNIINQGKLRSVLVFELGANEGWSSTTIQQLMDYVNNAAKVVVLTSYVETNDLAQRDALERSNEALLAAESEYDNLIILDWASEIKSHPRYFQGSSYDGIHYGHDGHRAFLQFIKDNLPRGSCTVGLASEDTNEGIVWNYLREAGIDGVSDNPAVIAGVLGNYQDESTFDPFVYNNGYYGIHMDDSGNLKKVIDDAGLGQYWHLPGAESTAGPNEVKKAIELEMSWILNSNARWTGSGDGWDKKYAFLPNINNVDDTNSPESYAELYLVTVEGAWDAPKARKDYPDRMIKLEDSKVLALAQDFIQSYGLDSQSNGTEWQDTDRRRNFAREVYDRFANSTSIPSGSSTGFSSTDELSGTNNVKFDATAKEIRNLLLFSLWKAKLEDRDYRDVLSKILDDFDNSGEGEKGAASSLIKYVNGSERFRYRNDYDAFKEDYTEINKEIKIESEQLEAANTIIKEGLRTTTEARVETTQYVSGVSSNSSKNSTNVCKNNSKKGRGAAKIAEVAALMSWPVQEWQKDADDFDTLRIGQCYDDGDGKWHPYKFDNLTGTEKCTYTPRNLYRNNHTTLGSQSYVDCGTFVGSVLKYLDLLGDYNWGMYGQPGAAKNFFRVRTDEWQELPDGITEADLKPGDIIWDDSPANGGKGKHGHIIVYIGEEYGKEYGNIAHASAGTRVGEISNLGSSLSEWAVFRYIGGKLGGGDYGEGADAIANAAEAMAWPLPTDGSWVSANAMAGKLTEEYSEARDRWFGSNTNTVEGNANDVSCARFASLAILESGVDPSFARSPSAASRSNIRWLNGSESGDGMEGYLANSSNWKKVSSGQLERGDVVISTLPHVWIYLGDGLIAEGAADSGNVVNGVKMNRSGAIIKASPESGSYPFNSSYTVYRLKE